ncbi:COBRA-like protein 1 [Elaeis guineensis]|uniref:COBRA-like protein n=1 Tax=Elaeis guineensis var. tenera TaxID=51953 RepID=A0A6I9SBM3_ELAGV|nr:COBRA-like protein 1 [Elaeis guineensis]
MEEQARPRIMELLIPHKEALVLILLLVESWNLADCYDPLDPNGNITVTFDIFQWTQEGYMARVTIQNYYQYRHVEIPGWSLGWTWAEQEVIESMAGALATQQGDCSRYKYRTLHCCKRDPVIIDLTPDAAPENRTANCCHSGILSAWAIDQSTSFSSFIMVVGGLDPKAAPQKPQNLTFLAPGSGYTCGPFEVHTPTVFSVVEGRREEQAFKTWKSACTYSSFVANNAPACCVSLSTFYNPKITPCSVCSCGCQASGNERPTCVGDSEMKRLPGDDNSVGCSDHMCPVRVHWHVKSNYIDYWKVKVTVSNYNFASKFSNWNLVIQHPAFGQRTLSHSFNSTGLATVGNMDEAAIFWGLEYYNKELLQAGDKEPGSVMTEMVMHKDPESFTLRNGWAFPRRVYFNAEICEMPMPDDFPRLPNTSSRPSNACYLIFILSFLILLFH